MSHNHNNALYDALLHTSKGQKLVVEAKEFKRAQYQARVGRYNELKELVAMMFPKRPDILYHATTRPENGSSRLWEIAGSEDMTAQATQVLQWAGTGGEAEIKAKLFVNPPLK